MRGAVMRLIPFLAALACAAALSAPALAHNVWLEPDAGGGYSPMRLG